MEFLTRMRVLLDQIPEQTIRHAVKAVFGSDSYGKSSWLIHFRDWLWRMLARFFSWLAPAFGVLRRSPPLFWAVLILLALLTAAVVARWIYLWRARNALRASGAGWELAGGVSRADAWNAAQMLAARGEYTAAAHALYAALLDAGARQQQLKLHPSKTAGDYVREARRSSSPIFPGFRDFARAYEFVIYGLGVCDRERYERLLSIALPIVTPRG
ncbi:MAG TPA: DUF4129 domain-containing protein [Gemmatimonadaceae bacterium]|nr:DUF4129 domain-containing protein [Gemmatimonadaceae bacterium]